MVPEDLLFWIAPLAATPYDGQSVLCLRHADAMSVPRGWTLDDRREEIPRLFMPRAAVRPERSRNGTRSRRAPRPSVEQLQIDGTGEIERPTVGDADEGTPDDAASWEPTFDQENDLDGLLQVSSPLLARAFRGTDRPRD
jgi:hypothetical protein